MLLCSVRARTNREATVVGSAGQIRIHPPVLCPSSLTLSQRSSRTGSGGVARATLAARLGKRFVRYGKDNRLARRLRERYWTLGERLVHGVRTRVIRTPVVGQGLHYQAAEVMRCLRAGRAESDVMPLAESVAIMETVDRIRDQWEVPIGT